MHKLFENWRRYLGEEELVSPRDPEMRDKIKTLEPEDYPLPFNFEYKFNSYEKIAILYARRGKLLLKDILPFLGGASGLVLEINGEYFVVSPEGDILGPDYEEMDINKYKNSHVAFPDMLGGPLKRTDGFRKIDRIRGDYEIVIEFPKAGAGEVVLPYNENTENPYVIRKFDSKSESVIEAIASGEVKLKTGHHDSIEAGGNPYSRNEATRTVVVVKFKQDNKEYTVMDNLYGAMLYVMTDKGAMIAGRFPSDSTFELVKKNR